MEGAAVVAAVVARRRWRRWRRRRRRQRWWGSEGGGGEGAHNSTIGETEADATGAGVRAVPEMVEEARAAVEKATAARVAIAAMRQQLPANRSTCTTNGPPAPSIELQKVCHANRRPSIVASTETLLRSIQCMIATHNKTLHGSRVHKFERSQVG